MINTILEHRLDIIAFNVLLWLVALATHVWLRRRDSLGGLSIPAWLLLASVTVVASAATEWAGERERNRLREMLGGIAPTYAQELQLMGHQDIELDTPADDPSYLAMIDAERRWLKVNPDVNDIYTFRRLPDGGVVLLVDSETDYDHNGEFEGEREQRTAIGEAYPDADENLLQTFDGTASFDGVPYTDRWGTWVSAYVPMYDKDGKVESVLGVDYDASTWASAIERAHLAALGFGVIVVMAILGANAIVGVTRAELRKRTAAERALRESESRLRTILDTEPEWVQVTDIDGRITQVNPAGLAMLGAARPEDVMGALLFDRVKPEHREAYVNLQTRCRESTGGTLRFAIQGADADRWLDAHAVPLRDANGNVTAVLSVLRDITEQKRAEEERERLQRALIDASRQAGMAEVATGVLHNVGNVLNSVRVSTGALSETIQTSKLPAFRRAAAMIRDHRDDLAEFLTTDARGRLLPQFIIEVSDLLTAEQTEMAEELTDLAQSVEHIKQIVASQQTHAKDSNVNETFDVVSVLNEAIRLNGPTLAKHRVEIEQRCDDPVVIEADRHKTLQILVNLIGNGAQAIGAGGESGLRKITIATDRVTGEAALPMVRIAVIDTGTGIDPQSMSELFRHGYTTRADGHGFGLHASAIAAKQMSGSLKACSDGLGTGATFTLELPLKPAVVETLIHA